jgi:uncharacterized protein YndB with AHSA1/START domain
MPGIVEYPQVVQEALRDFDDLFANDCQRRHFAEYLTGLYVAERKTVTGINREFAQTTDQSCLNRFLTEAPWDVQALNQRRLDLLQKDSASRYSAHGVIALDNVLIDHDGQMIPDASWFWDHAEERFKIAQDYIFVNYVCTSGRHYPLEFRRFRSEGLCDCLGDTFEDHTTLCRQLIDWVGQQQIPGAFTFDSYFTNALILNHIQSQLLPSGEPRAYVGDLKFNRKLEWKGRTLKASELAAEIRPENRKEVRLGARRQWYFSVTLRIPKVNHKVRIVILWKERSDTEACKMVVSNRVTWEVSRILRVYRHRWTGTETFHRDGKQHLGMGACQLRDPEGQTRHMYLVMLAYSLVMRQLKQGHAWEWASQKLTTIGEACRAILRESLRKTLTWAITQVTERAWSVDQVTDHLGLMGAKP